MKQYRVKWGNTNEQNLFTDDYNEAEKMFMKLKDQNIEVKWFDCFEVKAIDWYMHPKKHTEHSNRHWSWQTEIVKV